MKKPEDNPFVKGRLDFEKLSELGKEKAKHEVELLREAINYHDYLYYVENDPIISDKKYDMLFERLQDLEDEFGLLDENSPTQRVGGEPVDSLETREHSVEMLSLDASEDEIEVRRFDERVRKKIEDVEYFLEPKYDGFSIEIIYEKGELQSALTRGNGVEGENVTKNVRTIRTVPLELSNAPHFLSLRGEIYMPKKGFQDLNKERVEKGLEPFSNPRNAAAGTVRQLNPEVVAERPLDIYFYDVMDSSKKLNSQEEASDLMKDLGLKTNHLTERCESVEAFIKYRNELMEKRDNLEYDIDGVVAKVNDFKKRRELGSTSRHPRWAFAYKFPPKSGETVVQDVVVQVGRTGKLTPVALLEPVDVKGVTISRATLHNESQAAKLGVKKGSKVKVQRAGDVIPEVVEVLDNEGSFAMPQNCPICGSEVEKEGKYHYCTGGVSCPGQVKRGLQHYASKGAMNIEGLGDKVANLLIEEELVETLPDLYKLEVEDLKNLEGWGEKSAEKLIKEIEGSKEVDLASFIYALGIRHVGKETARLLAENFTLDELREASESDFMKVREIGDKVAESIESFFEGAGYELVEDLLDKGVSPEQVERGMELKNLTLVFTGGLEGFTRDEVSELMERHGADVTSSVSEETDYVIVGENPGSKLDDAEDLGIETLKEDEFKEEILSEIRN